MSSFLESLKFLLLSTAYWAYIVWGHKLVTEEWTLPVNGFLLPFLVGSIGYLIFKNQKALRIILATAAALMAALIAIKSGDPAKPGLHIVAIATITAISFLGAVTTAGIITMVHKNRGTGL